MFQKKKLFEIKITQTNLTKLLKSTNHDRFTRNYCRITLRPSQFETDFSFYIEN